MKKKMATKGLQPNISYSFQVEITNNIFIVEIFSMEVIQNLSI